MKKGKDIVEELMAMPAKGSRRKWIDSLEAGAASDIIKVKAGWKSGKLSHLDKTLIWRKLREKYGYFCSRTVFSCWISEEDGQ